ncbi:MAG: BatD family protein [Pseudomonadales bacterium]
MSPVNPGKCLLGALLLACALASQTVFAASVKAFVDRDKISIVDSFSLTIRSSEGSAFDNPDFTALEEDFDVLSTRRSSQHSIVNGRAESSMEWHIDLAPKRSGDLVIPPIEVNGVSTEALVIQVSDAPPPSQRAGNDPVFLESEIEQNEAYVQAQLILTVRIYYAVAIARGAELEELEIADALVTKLNEASYETTIRTMRYNVHEVKYAIFPQRSGELRIPPQTFSARLSGQRSYSMFGATRGKTVRARSQEHSIRVKPKAAKYTAKHWLPAENLSLVESWSKDPEQLRVGEPITRTITVITQGLQAAQIPPLDMQDLANAQQYPDQAKNNDEPSLDGVTGTRIESVAIIPSAGDSLQLPEIRLPWWNTKTNKQEVAIIPAKHLPLLGGSAVRLTPIPTNTAADDPTTQPTTNAAPPPAAAVSKFWVYSAGLMALAWALTLWYVFYLRQRVQRAATTAEPTTQFNEAQAFAKVNAACEQRKPADVRTALINWGRIFWNSESISALSDISRRCNADRLQTLFVELDQTMYSTLTTAADFDFTKFENELVAWRKEQHKRRKKKPAELLPPLYKSAITES